MDLLDEMQRAFPKYNFRRMSPPSYVEFHDKHDNDIILVTCRNTYSTTKTAETSQKSEELDLTGSPLKLDLSLNIMDDTLLRDEIEYWSKEEATHYPVPIQDGRKIANLYNEMLRDCNESETTVMWIVTTDDDNSTLLIKANSYCDYFNRGIVTYCDNKSINDEVLNQFFEEFIQISQIDKDNLSYELECQYEISGVLYGGRHRTSDDILVANNTGGTYLNCYWKQMSLQPNLHNTKINLVQEVIIGHSNSICNVVWKSICSLYNINQIIVDTSVVTYNTININDIAIRQPTILDVFTIEENAKRICDLLSEVESYSYTTLGIKYGCIFVDEETNSLKQALLMMNKDGSSFDFTYRLWNILKDCGTVDELVTLLIQALRTISSGNIKPYISANNKTQLGKLVLKLSRGHSQSDKVLKNLRKNPGQALILVAQVGFEKTAWEYTNLLTLVDQSFAVNNLFNVEIVTPEAIEQINQTINEMTLGGELTLNPFENKTFADTSIKFGDSFMDESNVELTVNQFESLKRQGLVNEGELPLMSDEIDVGGWKYLLTRFAQTQVCLEHLMRAQDSLRLHFGNLSILWCSLRDEYLNDKSPIRSVGQLLNDPIHKYVTTLRTDIVSEHIKNKLASWYKVKLTGCDNSSFQSVTCNYILSQQSLFPPTILPAVNNDNYQANNRDIKYECTRYLYMSNKVLNNI